MDPQDPQNPRPLHERAAEAHADGKRRQAEHQERADADAREGFAKGIIHHLGVKIAADDVEIREFSSDHYGTERLPWVKVEGIEIRGWTMMANFRKAHVLTKWGWRPFSNLSTLHDVLTVAPPEQTVHQAPEPTPVEKLVEALDELGILDTIAAAFGVDR